MIKLIHAADMHLDTPFTGSGLDRSKVEVRRQDLFDSVRNIVQAANDHKVDAILLAGDLYESEYMNIATFQRMMQLFAESSPIPVVISPGNHDYYSGTSLYAIEDIPENVHIFSKAVILPMVFEELDLTIYGTAFTSPHVKNQRWKGYVCNPATSISVILTHGAIFRGDEGQTKDYLPIDLEDVKQSGADYVALGHFHRQVIVYVDPFTDSVRAAYPGSPDALHPGSGLEHGALLVKIDSETRKVEVESIITQKRNFASVKLDLSEYSSVSEIDAVITQELMNPDHKDSILRLELIGSIPSEMQIEKDHYQQAASALFSFTIKDKTYPDHDLDTLSKEQTARGAFCRDALRRLKTAEDEDDIKLLEEAIRLGLAAFEGQNVGEYPL